MQFYWLVQDVAKQKQMFAILLRFLAIPKGWPACVSKLGYKKKQYILCYNNGKCLTVMGSSNLVFCFFFFFS